MCYDTRSLIVLPVATLFIALCTGLSCPGDRTTSGNGGGTTIDGTNSDDGNAPAIPGAPAPADGATNVSTSLWTKLDWSPVAEMYDVYFGTDSGQQSLLESDTNTSETSTYLGLRPNTKYYWRVVAKNAYGSTTGPTWSFVTGGQGDGTGVTGLDTPSEILSNSQVSSMIEQVRNLGYNLNLATGSSPPNIQGTYSISGTNQVPFVGPLSPGTWRWSNQTSDNHITTDFTQFLFGGQASGSSAYGEIVRGTGQTFTVYSIIRLVAAVPGGQSCVAQYVQIIDGSRDANGDVSGVFVGAVTRNDTPDVCTVIGAAGTFTFDRQ